MFWRWRWEFHLKLRWWGCCHDRTSELQPAETPHERAEYLQWWRWEGRACSEWLDTPESLNSPVHSSEWDLLSSPWAELSWGWTEDWGGTSLSWSPPWWDLLPASPCLDVEQQRDDWHSWAPQWGDNTTRSLHYWPAGQPSAGHSSLSSRLQRLLLHPQQYSEGVLTG